MSLEEDLRRLEELAVSRLLEPLSTDEAEEYAALKSRVVYFDEAAIEKVVALAHLAALPATEPAPPTLGLSVEKEAAEFFGDRYLQSPMAPGKAPPRRRPAWMSAAGWWFGLAASVVAVFVVLHRTPAGQEPSLAARVAAPAPVADPPVVPPPPSAPATVQPQTAPAETTDSESQWRAFLASHPRAIQRAWRAGGDPTGERVVGDVLWDAASQTGYMRFVNLRRNEPNAEQYQLWIFDAERDQRYPVDGGVFDVTTAGGEQIVRIHAKLRVRVASVFAVTVEHPGGVVVSDRARIAAIAKVS